MGRRAFPERVSGEWRRPERRHLPEPSGYDREERVTWTRKGRALPPSSDSEVSIEMATGTKKKVSVDGQRNGLPVRARGDKPYAIVDLSPGFCKLEGLIPGFRPERGGKRQRGGALAATGATAKLSHAEKRQAEERQADLREVIGLTCATGDIPSWEDRTGCHTWVSKKKTDDLERRDSVAN